MKCTNKYISLILILILALSFSGCSDNSELATYEVYTTSRAYGILNSSSIYSAGDTPFFAKDICVAEFADIGTASVDAYIAQASGCFNLSKNEVVFAQNIYDKIYPASTTKIVTCILACEYGNFDAMFTASAHAVDQESDSSVIKLKEGDTISLNDLLYGLMLRSGNDAAVVIAEGIGGTEEAFIQKMNDFVTSLGCTSTHFVNPNGLHDENHYTSVYDMYLIMNYAVKNPDFVKYLSANKYSASYLDKIGKTKNVDWESTNKYTNLSTSMPLGFNGIGGKTGTTGAAGYCLVQLSTNAENEYVMSLVYNADGRSNLYYYMNQILQTFGN